MARTKTDDDTTEIAFEVVDSAEIADRLGYSKQTVMPIIARDPSFPLPIKQFSGGFRIWWWPDVAAWAARPRRGWTVSVEGKRVRTNLSGRARTASQLTG